MRGFHPLVHLYRVPLILIWALRLAVALAILALLLIPANVWSHPSTDMTARGFDSATAFVNTRGPSYVFAPFQILTNGDWHNCPCAPGTQLVLVGNGLSPRTLSDPEGATSLGGMSVLVDGRPTRVYVVSPGQVNFFLRADVRSPASTITLLANGLEVGQQRIAVDDGSAAGSPSAAEVLMQPDRVRLLAPPPSQPSVHLFTTPLNFRASFDVTVDEGSGGTPFQAMLWNPRNSGAVSIVFGPPPDRRISAVVTEDHGRETTRRDLGTYGLSQAIHIEVGERHGEQVDLAVQPANGSGPPRRASFTPAEAPGLFAAFRPTLTVLSAPAGGSSAATLTNYRLDIPHQRTFSVRANDAKILPLVLALLALSVTLHARLIVVGVRRAGAALAHWPTRAPKWTLVVKWAWLGPVAAVVCSGVVILTTLGSHPFDMTSQKVWTYLVVTDGFGDLYYRAQTVPVAEIWNGMPFHEAVYPYGVGMSYYFYAIGWGYRLLGGSVAPDSMGLEITIKLVGVAVAIADAALLFSLVRGFGRRRYTWLVPLAFLLNPAILFDVLIWGETEPVALFFLLASVLAAQRSSARGAWALLAVALLGKQTVVIPAVLIGAYYLRLFPLRRTLEAFGTALPVVLALLLPYIVAGYPPSIAVDPILGSFRVFGGDQMEKVFQVVSFDAYTVWPLVTLIWNGQHGVGRLAFPDSAGQLGPLNYHQAGALAFFAVLGCTVIWLMLSRRLTKEPGVIFLVLACAMLAELVLPTRSIARYMIFPLVFALLAVGASPTPRGVFVVVTLTVTSLIGMFGSVASGVQAAPSLAPHLAPANNVVSAAALRLFRADLVITLGSLANLTALLVLAVELTPLRHVLSRVTVPLPIARARPAFSPPRIES